MTVYVRSTGLAIAVAVLFMMSAIAMCGRSDSVGPGRLRYEPDGTDTVSTSSYSVGSVASRETVLEPDSRERPSVPDLDVAAARVDASRTGRLTIRLISEDGETVHGCSLVLRPLEAGRISLSGEWSMVELPDGSHECLDLAFGIYSLVCEEPLASEAIRQIRWRGEAAVSEAVPIAPRSSLLGGTVLDEGGDPVAGFVVRDANNDAKCDYCVTDEFGRFVFCARTAGLNLGASLFRLADETGSGGVVDAPNLMSLDWGHLDHVVTLQRRRSASVYLFDSSDSPVGVFSVRALSLIHI